MKKEFNIKDKVWIAMGERKLVEGRVVEIIDLEHLNEGHSPDRELYIIEIKTGIDDVYEVRTWDQISPDARGPLNLFRSIKEESIKNNRLLKKLGMPIPNVEPDLLAEIVEEINKDLQDEEDEVDPAIIHAAMEKSQQGVIHQPLDLKPASAKPKRRYYKKKK